MAEQNRDMHVRLQYADITVVLVAEGVSYSPDALSDMSNRAVNMLAESLLLIGPYERSLVGADDEDDDDEE